MSVNKQSGEFICATPTLEIHLYLQEGRVAWAIDSQHPLAFTRHLQASNDIDRDTLQQVIDECRREKLPLGETLVEWGLASWESVRASLRHQITAAIGLLCSIGNAKTLFLERGYDRYNPRLTFDLAELLAEVSAASEPEGTDADPSIIVGQLHDAIDGLSWVEVIDGERLLDGSPASELQRAPAELLRNSVLDGADFFAVRTGSGSVVGVRLPSPGRSLWCGLDSSSTFGAAVSALWAIASASDSAAGPGIEPAASVHQFAGERGAAATQTFARFLERAPEIAAAIVERGGDPTLGYAADTIEPEQILDLIRRRRRCLDADLWGEASGSEPDRDRPMRQMASREGRLWLFGGPLDDDERVWLALDRRSSQGLGWAYLSALERGLSAPGGVF